jgi:hypothetical protein
MFQARMSNGAFSVTDGWFSSRSASGENRRSPSLDDAGLHFDIDTGSGHAPLTLPWTEPVVERGDIRADIVRRYHAAREVLGLGPADPH